MTTFFFPPIKSTDTRAAVCLVTLGLVSGCVGSSNYLATVEDTQAQPQPTPSAPNTTNPKTFQPVPLGRALPQPNSTHSFLPETQKSPKLQSSGELTLVSENNSLENDEAPESLAAIENEKNSESVAIGVSSNSQIDPVKTATIKRINSLYRSIDHGKCDSEFGPKPKRIEAKRINPDDPYYIEFRMRNTPLMPVGHTFVVYGQLDANGEPTNERMAMLAPQGGYAGASVAAALPVPGVLKPYGDDCKISPETAYRVSLSPERYEAFLLELQKAKQEKAYYLLFTQNCNHFTQRMADSVGVLPPKNKYVPAVDYLYDLIEANEGIKVDRRYRSKIAGIPDWPTPDEIKAKQAAQRGKI